MDINTTGFAWNTDGTLLDHNGPDTKLTGYDLLLNQLFTHLLTSPGEYKPDRSLGLGIMDIVGSPNTEEDRQELKKRINDYFLSLPVFSGYRINTEVSATAPTEIQIRLVVYGFGLEVDAALLINIASGRIVSAYDFTQNAEVPVVSTTETEDMETVNPYLARLIAAQDR